MNWKLLLLPLMVFWSELSSAQEDKREEGRIEAMRVRYISEKVGLTPEEEDKFWSLYNRYRREMDEIKRRRMDKLLNGRPGKPIEEMSEDEARQLIESELQRGRDFVNLREKYYRQFREVLSAKKTALLYKAELDFHKRLIHKLSENCDGKKEKNH